MLNGLIGKAKKANLLADGKVLTLKQNGQTVSISIPGDVKPDRGMVVVKLECAGAFRVIPDQILETSELSSVNAIPVYAYSSMDYYSSFRSTVGFSWNFKKSGKTIVPAIVYTAGDRGKELRLIIDGKEQVVALYAIAQSEDAGIVLNTSNLSEDWVGYCTVYGDATGAFSPLGMYTTEEVIALGAELGLPEKFLIKPPSDGLTGLTDEDNLGFTYHAVNEYVRKGVVDPAVKEKIDRLHRTSRFKFQLMPVYHNGLPMALTDETDYYK